MPGIRVQPGPGITGTPDTRTYPLSGGYTRDPGDNWIRPYQEFSNAEGGGVVPESGKDLPGARTNPERPLDPLTHPPTPTRPPGIAPTSSVWACFPGKLTGSKVQIIAIAHLAGLLRSKSGPTPYNQQVLWATPDQLRSDPQDPRLPNLRAIPQQVRTNPVQPTGLTGDSEETPERPAKHT